MAYFQIDESTDKPVDVEVRGDAVRIRYGTGASIALDLAESLNLAVKLVTVLIECEPGPTDPIDPMDSVKSAPLLEFINSWRDHMARFIADAEARTEQIRQENES